VRFPHSEFSDDIEFKYRIRGLKSRQPAVGIRFNSLYYTMPVDTEVKEETLRAFLSDYENGKILGQVRILLR
jgi:hypothetical protein